MTNRTWEERWNEIEREANETQRMIDELKSCRRSTMSSIHKRHENLDERLARTDVILDELLK